MSVRVRRVWMYRLGLLLPIWLIGCLAPPDEGVDEGRLDVAGHLTTPSIMSDVMTDWFAPGRANVAIVPVKSGSTAVVTDLGSAAQSFGALLQSAPTGAYRDRVVARTEGIFAARTGTTLGGVTTISTSGAQQYICPISGSFAASIGGQTPTTLVMQDTAPDATDSPTADLCGAPTLRTLRTGTILIADGPVARQWNGSSFVAFAVTGLGKPCIGGDSGPACVAKFGAQTNTLAYADSRIQLGSSISLLKLDSVVPFAAGYPRIRDIHLVDVSDTDPRVTGAFLWLDGDGTLAHPAHHADFEARVSARGLMTVASF